MLSLDAKPARQTQLTNAFEAEGGTLGLVVQVCWRHCAWGQDDYPDDRDRLSRFRRVATLSLIANSKPLSMDTIDPKYSR